MSIISKLTLSYGFFYHSKIQPHREVHLIDNDGDDIDTLKRKIQNLLHEFDHYS